MAFHAPYSSSCQGTTTAAEAVTDAATGEALVAGSALGRLFHDAATKHWGQLHPYTGD
jgi:hypothetical protein